MSKYQYFPYESVYPSLFTREKEKIEKVLPVAISIEHFGSTAVPNLGGKGIIDIYVVVPSGMLETYSPHFVKLGYTYPKMDAENDPERLYCSKEELDENGILRKYHVHICQFGYADFTSCIAFRDYLRSHPDAVKKYDEVKKTAVIEADKFDSKEEKRNAYMAIKGPFIKKLLSEIANDIKIRD